MISAFLFDLDGVIVFTDKYHYRGWKRLATEMGWKFDEEVNHQCRGIPRLASLQVILDHNRLSLPAAEKERLAGIKNTYYKESLADISRQDLYPGILPFLEAVRGEDIRMAVCSSSRNAESVLEALDLRKWFEAVITGNDITRPKPDPEIFLKGAAALGVPPEQCIVFEDAASGVEAAHAAGMRCVGVGSPMRLPTADMTVTDYAEIDLLGLTSGQVNNTGPDPFAAARKAHPVLECPFQGETVPMLLRHSDVKAAAKDWRTFSSDAPFRVPIPSEEELRSVRQLPIETDPPAHTAFRAVTDPFFKRPLKPEIRHRITNLVDRLLTEAIHKDVIEIVHDFALPLQSSALTILLDVPESEAAEWINWGIHVFRDGGDGRKKGAVLEDYISRQLEKAEQHPGEDFFSALVTASIDGRPLSHEERMGFANLVFAGGRDTVIQSITGVMNHFAEHPDDLDRLRNQPGGSALATEEFFRILSPLTHIGRVCPVDTDVHGTNVPANGRVSLCWSSANFDEAVFEEPHAVRLDRKPNPHLAFGAGSHFCQGAFHARLLIRTLIDLLCHKVSRIRLIERIPLVEKEAVYSRIAGCESLKVSLESLETPPACQQ
jgi:beta-phosphoglucomutase